MSKKLLTVIPELDNAAIRRTPDGRCSVYDLISVAGGQKNPRQAWERLIERYPEVVPKCDNFKFPGRGQRQTPVTDREGFRKQENILQLHHMDSTLKRSARRRRKLFRRA